MAATLAALDPGLDATAVALFDLNRWLDGGNFIDALRIFVGTVVLSTRTTDDISRRLAELYRDLAHLLHEQDTKLAYIELPAIEGDYGIARRGQRRGSVNRMYEARGALLAALGVMQVPTFEHRAGASSKHHRRTMLETGFGSLGFALPVGPKGGKREDEWDAIWIGAWALTTRYRQDVARIGASLSPR